MVALSVCVFHQGGGGQGGMTTRVRCHTDSLFFLFQVPVGGHTLGSIVFTSLKISHPKSFEPDSVFLPL